MAKGEVTKEESETLKANFEKMRRKFTLFNKSIKEFPNMQVSFLSRAKAMEVCFGDPDREEPNIAASILRSIMALNADVRVLSC